MLELEGVITELLAAGQPVHFRAMGQSMWPLIQSGAILHVVPAGSLSIGEIVLYKSAAGGVLAHRLVNIKNSQTRGDNSQHIDGPGEIIGRVTGVEQGGRYLNLTHPLWRTFNRAIGHASALQLKLNTSYQQSPNFLKLLGRKVATAIFRGLLGLTRLGFRNLE